MERAFSRRQRGSSWLRLESVFPLGIKNRPQRLNEEEIWIRRPVSRVLCRPPFGRRDDHSSGPSVAGRFSRPTRTARAGEALPEQAPARRPYSVLLQAGLAMPSPSPGPRWALTPPFHPYPQPRPWAVCFLWRYPWGHPRRALPAACSPWSPDFPRPLQAGTATARPSGPRRR